ncbi:3-galactosyl-N-acetylglucosaminide 4-alpha-L-fucosyltransferase FUT3-like [Styela clava]
MMNQKNILYVCALFCVGFIIFYQLLYRFDNSRSYKNIGTNASIGYTQSIGTWMSPSAQNGTTNFLHDRALLKQRPKILIWAKPYHKIEWRLTDLPEQKGGCDVTLDRNEYESSDAVLFYMKSCVAKDLPDPSKRSSHQVFAWWAHESPWTVLHYYHHELKDFNNYFNWTMTYRRDSDVLASFAPTPSLDYLLYKFDRQNEMKDAELVKYPTMSEDRFRKEIGLLMAKKSKLIAWVVSDCSVVAGASKRMKLVDDMTKDGLLEVERFGKCANRPIPNDFNVFLETIAPFKFYLSFENSLHCRDYITEKTFYNALVGGIIPVIHGPTKEDAIKILPKRSFIHLEDFENLNKLAEYLKYLDSNDTAYLEYFDWWKEPGTHVIPRYGFNFGPQHENSNYSNWFHIWKTDDVMQKDMMEFERFGLYHLCRKLRNKEHMTKPKVIADLNQWWYGTESEECMR